MCNYKAMNKIIPKLGLDDLTDNKLTEYAQHKVEMINATPAFASVNPSTATVSAKKIQYADALVKADDGTVADTALKNKKRAELEELLTAQATDCARIANGNLPLYLNTGYEAKKTKGSPVGELSAVTGVELFYGDNSGDLKIKWNTMPKAQNFTLQIYSDINNPDTSVIKEYIIKKIGRRKTTLSGLPSGKIVFARVRANGGSTGHGAWSDPAEKRVP